MILDRRPGDSLFPKVETRNRLENRRVSSRTIIRGTPTSLVQPEDERIPHTVDVEVLYPSSKISFYNRSHLVNDLGSSVRQKGKKKRKKSEEDTEFFSFPHEGSEELGSGSKFPEEFRPFVEVRVLRNPLLGLPAFRERQRRESFYNQNPEREKRGEDSFVRHVESYRGSSFSHFNTGVSKVRNIASFMPSRRRRTARNPQESFVFQDLVQGDDVVVPEHCPDDLMETEEGRTWVPGKVLRVAYVTWNMANREPKAMQLSSKCVHPNAHIIIIATQENGPYIGSNKYQRDFERLITSECLKDQYEEVATKKMWAMHLMVLARKRDVARYVSHIESAKVSSGILGIGGNKGAVGVSFFIHLSPFHSTTIQKCAEEVGNSSITEGTKQGNDMFSPSLGPSSLDSPVLTMLFINAHLPAHLEAIEKRNICYHKILKSIALGKKGRFPQYYKLRSNLSAAPLRFVSYSDVGVNPLKYSAPKDSSNIFQPRSISAKSITSSSRLEVAGEGSKGAVRNASDEFDITFFGGDLNYRIDGKKDEVEELVTTPAFFSRLLANDQLLKEKARGNVFAGFQEGKLAFRPTYKYEIPKETPIPRQRVETVNSVPNPLGYQDGIKGKKARIPAYCDRVFFRTPQHSKVSKAVVSLYTDVQEVTTSDHRPVVSLFDLYTKPSTTLP